MSTSILSNYLEYNIINNILTGGTYQLPSTIYLTLYSNNPGEADTGTEIGSMEWSQGTAITGENIRTPIVRSLNLQNSNNVITNINNINFSEATYNWGTVNGWGIKDEQYGGNLLFYGLLDSSIYVSTGDTFTVGAGQLEISFLNPSVTNGGLTAFAVPKLIDWIINDTFFSYTFYGSQLALGRNANLDSSNRLLSWTECDGTGYARKVLSTGDWTSLGSGNTDILTNINEQIFVERAEDDTWGTISHIVLYDNETGDNPIIWGRFPTSVTIKEGDSLKIASNGINIQFL